jgi:uncharacterized glyoxalase superfamily protein PhnB
MTEQLPGGTPPPTVWPTLRAKDARALIAFLVDVLGFEETAVFGDGDVVQHAQLSWPAGGGIMMGSERDTPDDIWKLPVGGFGAYAVAEDAAAVDAVHSRAVAAGADILRPPHTTDYGSYEVAVRDPEGNLWSIGTYRGEPRKG